MQDTFRRYIFNKAEFALSSLTASGVILFIGYVHRNTGGSKCDILFCGNSFGLDNESSPARNLICCSVNTFAGRADWISETITRNADEQRERASTERELNVYRQQCPGIDRDNLRTAHFCGIKINNFAEFEFRCFL